MSNVQPSKVTTIKMKSTLSSMPPQRLSIKVQLDKNAKNTKLLFGPNPELMFSKSPRGINIGNLKLLQ